MTYLSELREEANRVAEEYLDHAGVENEVVRATFKKLFVQRVMREHVDAVNEILFGTGDDVPMGILPGSYLTREDP